MEILHIKNLTFTYPDCITPCLNGIDFDIKKGEFVAVCGPTGSGKSTLLRLLKREISPLGKKEGNILFEGTPLEALDNKTSACAIGYVMQNPDLQPVADTVFHELAFGLESIQLSHNEMRRRIAEVACFFGIEHLLEHRIDELSGGQKQLLNLACVIAMRPKVLLLDEPISQLDPIACVDFLSTLRRLNEELGITIIMVEHRLDDILPLCDRLMILQQGRIFQFGQVNEVCSCLKKQKEQIENMPTPVRLYYALERNDFCPVGIRQARNYLQTHFSNNISSLSHEKKELPSHVAMQMRDVWFRYQKDSDDILCGLDLTVYENEILCILGGNGSGKTTMMKVLAGLMKPYHGKIRIFGKSIKDYSDNDLYGTTLCMLSQNVQTLFLYDCVEKELRGCDTDFFGFDWKPFWQRHPYDLSGGQQQLLALTKVLSRKPRLLLLDEPTKGFDNHTKNAFIRILKHIQQQGTTIIIVTHDAEFACSTADRCALFFRGEITVQEPVYDFFCSNNFYTTVINRICSGYYENILTLEDLVQICQKNEKGGIPS